MRAGWRLGYSNRQVARVLYARRAALAHLSGAAFVDRLDPSR
jgi:hypothetical protein